MANKRSNYYLSEEMIFNILSYLPVLSLLRFKSVCKTWLSIISNPQFVEAHLTNSNKKQASVLKASYNWRVYSIDTREESVRLKLPSQCKGMVRYIRSCNGLVCLSNEHCDVICIWNPCTRHFKMLPKAIRNEARHPLYLGFGFDSIGNDYKILIIPFYYFNVQAELYSANNNSWKKFWVPKINAPFGSRPKKICGPAINGVLYLEVNGALLSFNLHNEVFGEVGVIPFPNHVQHKKSNALLGRKTKKSKVLDFEGSVAMIFESTGDESVLSLWTLDDVCGSWTKKFNLETDLKLDRVYLYLGDEQFVGQNFVFGYKFYDYRKKATKKLPYPAHLTDVKTVVKFTESLVSLEGFKLQE